MVKAIIALRWILRIAFLIVLAAGLVLWSGRGYQYLGLHMWIGFALTFDLLFLVVAALLARLRPVLPLIALVWTAALPVIGIAQLRVMPGPNHWIIRVIHLILGLGAIGLGEMLAKRSLLAQTARTP